VSTHSRYHPADLLGPLNQFEHKHAPAWLYTAGNVRLLRNGGRVAIVGSRRASAAGTRRTRKLARLLVARGVVVVSGLAEGIDTEAHLTAMKSGGRTIAVIGTPLDDYFPARNAGLQRSIAAHHLVVTQFAPGQPTQRKNFPLRNRTMALIADATVIIEAGDSSGSLSQGWEALRLGRPLFLARSLLGDTALAWPAKMIHYGARVLSEQTLEELVDCVPDRRESELFDAVPF
jgi:DNA processing protein